MEVRSVLRPKEQVRRILLRLAHVETHHVQSAGAFEVYAMEREEAFLHERASVGDNGGTLVQERFLALHGVDIKRAGALNMMCLDVRQA